MAELFLRIPQELKNQIQTMADKQNLTMTDLVKTELQIMVETEQLSKVDTGIKRQIDELTKTIQSQTISLNHIENLLVLLNAGREEF